MLITNVSCGAVAGTSSDRMDITLQRMQEWESGFNLTLFLLP